MRKIKVRDKDMNEKGVLTANDIDGEISFSVTENGFGDLTFDVVGDIDIEHADVVKVIESGETTREYYNHRFIDFDGTNDYARSGYSIQQPRRNMFGNGTFTYTSDGYGDYSSGFSSTTFFDIGKSFDEIATNKAFSFKLTVETPTTNNCTLMDFGAFQLFYGGGEIRVGFLGGVAKSHTIGFSTYARIVCTYDGAGTLALRVNSTLAVGTTAPSGSNSSYFIFGNRRDRSQPRTGGKFYNLAMYDVVLTGGEITTENANHLAQKTTNRFAHYRSSFVLFPGGGYMEYFDDNNYNPIIDTGIVSDTLVNNTHIVISAWIKNDIDGVDTDTSQPILVTPYYYLHVRLNSNQITARYDNAGGKVANYNLGNGDRARHHIVATVYNNGTNWVNQMRVDGVLQSTNTNVLGPSTKFSDYIDIGTYSSVYYNGKIGPTSIYTFTGSFVADDAIRMYKGLEPISTNIFLDNIIDFNKGDTFSKNNIDVFKWEIEPVFTESQMDKHFSTSHNYTHLLNFGQTSDIVVKGITMNRSVGEGVYSLTGFPNIMTNNLGGGVVLGSEWSKLEEDFLFGSVTNSVTLQGLTIGQKYKVVFFIGDWDGNNDPSISVKLLINGIDSGPFTRDSHKIISSGYIATSSSITISFDQLSGGTPHLYALANYEYDFSYTQYITIYGGTNVISADAPFARHEDRTEDRELYFGHVIDILPSKQSRRGKRTQITALGIQTVLNDTNFVGTDNTTSFDGLMYANEILQRVYDQNHLYMDYKGDYNLIYTQDFAFSDYRQKSMRKRKNCYVNTQNIVGPYGNNIDCKLLIPYSGSRELENVIEVTGHTQRHVITFRAKTQGGSLDIPISYGILNDTYFNERTFTVNTTRRRIGIIQSKTDSGSGIQVKIGSTSNIYLYDFQVYKVSDSTLKEFGSGIYQISYNNNKLIQVRQEAIEYGGGKIKRTANGYPICFEPDINGTPDHYISEEKHCSYIDNGTKSDEIRNSIVVEYDGGSTAEINDVTSINTYRKRQELISATNILDIGNATNYGNLYLDKYKNPQQYAKAVITNAYPIGTLRVGDLVQINGNTLQIARGYITRLDMSENDCTIYIGNYDGLGKILSLYK